MLIVSLQSGKAVHNIPMYINVWLMETGLWVEGLVKATRRCAVYQVLDIYKWFTQHLGHDCADNYH